MAKGTPLHTGDPNVQTGTFEPKPDGTYRVSGIERWISIDPSDNPVFVEQNGQLVVRFSFQKEDGTADGPACSASPAEFWAIVRAMGGDISSVKPQLRTTSESLIRAKDVLLPARTSPIVIEVTTKNGWVNGNRITAARPPEGKYTVRFSGAHRFDYLPGNYDFSEVNTKFGKNYTLVFDFEIVGGPMGEPSMWDGYVLADFFNNVFTDSYVDKNGKAVHAAEVGLPLYGRTQNGGVLPETHKWEIFAQYFAPSLADHDWQVDPARSSYHISEVAKPQYVYIDKALKDKSKVIVPWRIKERGVGMHLKFKDIPFENQAPAIEIKSEEPQPDVLLEVITYVEKTWPDIKIFDQSDPNNSAVIFTDEGRTWANQTLQIAWAQAGLTEHKRLDLCTEAELTSLLTALKAMTEVKPDGITW